MSRRKLRWTRKGVAAITVEVVLARAVLLALLLLVLHDVLELLQLVVVGPPIVDGVDQADHPGIKPVVVVQSP